MYPVDSRATELAEFTCRALELQEASLWEEAALFYGRVFDSLFRNVNRFACEAAGVAYAQASALKQSVNNDPDAAARLMDPRWAEVHDLLAKTCSLLRIDARLAYHATERWRKKAGKMDCAADCLAAETMLAEAIVGNLAAVGGGGTRQVASALRHLYMARVDLGALRTRQALKLVRAVLTQYYKTLLLSDAEEDEASEKTATIHPLR